MTLEDGISVTIDVENPDSVPGSWTQPGHCGHLRNKPANGQSISVNSLPLLLSFSHSVFKLTLKKNKTFQSIKKTTASTSDAILPTNYQRGTKTLHKFIM